MDNCALGFKRLELFYFLIFLFMCMNETNIGSVKIFNHIMEKKNLIY